jgi:pyruvate dehydrogenase E2 component (dihydrolipoamide acetyltransferase)
MRSVAALEPSRGRPLDATRRAIAERMTRANEAPQITLTVEARAGALTRLRESGAPRPSFSALFAVAVARALRDHPNLNVTFEDGAIVDHEGVHLGIAVARPAGLIVPVLHDADRLTVAAADRRIRELVARARDGGLRLEDVSGGTFTVTSLGEAGIDVFSPLLNPPQVGILGIGRLANRVVAVGDGIRVEPTVHLSLSCDHRVIDGEPGAAFLATLRGLLEEPGWLAGSLAAPGEEG